MKNSLFFFLIAILLLACDTRNVIPPSQSPYQRQAGLSPIDTTSYWKYKVTSNMSGDEYSYFEERFAIDTTLINGRVGFTVMVNSMFGSYNYAIRSDSNGVWYKNNDKVLCYQYPTTDTFAVSNDSCAFYAYIVNSDSLLTLDSTDYHTVVYHVFAQPCYYGQSRFYYANGIGLVLSEITYPDSSVRRSVLVAYK